MSATDRTAVDSSCIVALLSPWHESHDQVQARFDGWRGQELIIPGHVLIETYAVLTRLPPPYRVSGSDAAEGITQALASVSRVVGLGPADHWALLEELAGRGVAGGRSYDAAILKAAIRGGATELWTLNAAHFERLAGDEIEVVDLSGNRPSGGVD